MAIPRQLFKAVNILIPKRKLYIYAEPHTNCQIDKYDFFNYASDNLLTVINYIYNNYTGNKTIDIYLECYDVSRMTLLREYIASNPRKCIRLHPVLSYKAKNKTFNTIITRFVNMLRRYSCRTWLSDTGFCHYQDKLPNQTYICLNYCTPFKANFGINWKNDYSSMDGFIQTSMLTAFNDAAEYRVRLENCRILGFPRNDTLIHSEKKEAVLQWIYSKSNITIKKIVVYAPTYRDYRGAYDGKCIFGYDYPITKLEEWLTDREILIIVKLHPLQHIDDAVYTPHIIPYEKSYSFSLYDVLNVSDMLVSDYSSVIHDYLLTGKKIVLNFFDKDRFNDQRGFVFEPIEYVCPGPIVTTVDALLFEICSPAMDREKYETIKNMFHRYKDYKSTERVSDYLLKMVINNIHE